jgi:hypothetical protein
MSREDSDMFAWYSASAINNEKRAGASWMAAIANENKGKVSLTSVFGNLPADGGQKC